MTEENKTFDPWDKAFSKQDQQKKEREESKNFTSFDYEEIVYEGLAVGKPIAFRIVGNPAEYRMCPTDAKIVLQSKMVKDGEKGKTKINWRFTEKKGKYVIDPDWILSKLYNKVMEKKFVKYTEKDISVEKQITKSEDGSIKNSRGYEGEYKDLHTNTECYSRLKFNKLPSEEKTFGDAYPATRIVFNIISRMDDWCVKNKHTKLLSTKVGTKEVISDTGEKTTLYFPETGISKSMYDELLGYIRQIAINPTTTDFVITRTYNNDKYSQTIFDGNGLLKLGRGDKKILESIKEGSITEEEKSYGLYDLDVLFKEASYNKIKKNLTALFKLYDTEFNDNLYDELCALAEEEKKNNAENSQEDNEEDAPAKVGESQEVEKPATPEKKRVRGEVKTVDLSGLPFWSSLDDDDKRYMNESVLSFTNIDDMKFKPDTTIAPCTACKRQLPNTVLRCPFCDTSL